MSTDKPQFPSDLADKFMLRLPAGMRDRIKAAADANNRSMNAEIVAALQIAFPDRPKGDDAKFKAHYDQIMDRAGSNNMELAKLLVQMGRSTDSELAEATIAAILTILPGRKK